LNFHIRPTNSQQNPCQTNANKSVKPLCCGKRKGGWEINLFGKYRLRFKHLDLKWLLDCDIYGPTIPLMRQKTQPFIENDKYTNNILA
jgi:hypothetical protein